MTVPATDSRAGPFSGTGVIVPLPFDFKVFAQEDVLVTRTDVNGIESTLIVGIDYTVTLNPDQDADPGGTVTPTVAPAVGELTTLTSGLEYEQPIDLVTGGKFRAQTVEDGFDRTTMLIKQLKEQSDRSLHLSFGSEASSALPEPEANAILGWNPTATALQNVNPTTLATMIAYGAAQADLFDGNGIQTVFSLTANPAAQSNLDVAVGGVTQRPGIDYVWTSGTALTFTSPPPVGTNNVLARYMQGLPIGSADSQSVSFVASGAGATTRSVQDKLRELPSVTDYATIDPTGVADSYSGLQSFLDLGIWGLLPRGRYRTTQELVWRDGSGLFGADKSVNFWQFAANAPTAGEACEIFYDGPGGANSCVVRMSKQPVGTLPVFAPDESQTLKNAGVVGVVINGNNKAEFGLYSARAGLGCTYDKVCVTGTKKRGYFFGEFWTCRLGALFAIHNYGSGGGFGEDLFSWPTGNIVNAVHAELLVAFKNGLDSGYDEVTSPKEGVGWVLGWNRSCKVTTLVGELNYGPGLYVAPRTGPTCIEGLYIEDNCHFDPASDSASSTVSAYVDGKASQPWGMVGYNRETPSGGDSVQLVIEAVFGAAPGTAPVRYQHIWLTGDSSGGFVQEPTEPVVFRSFYGVRGITSDFYKYVIEYPQQAMIDSSPVVDLDRCLPSNGIPESVIGSVTTLHVGNTASGNKSGRDSANRMLLADAIECARVCKNVTVIDNSGMTSSSSPTNSFLLDGKGFTRRVTVTGGGVGRFNYATSDNNAVRVQNWNSQLTFAAQFVLDRVVATEAQLEIYDCPTVRTGANNDARAAIVLDRASVEINGTTVINVSNSTAATKVCLSLSGNSDVSVNNAAAGTLASYTAGNAIHFNEGSGIVRASITTATAAWAAAANVVRNTGGGAGMVLAPNGLNP